MQIEPTSAQLKRLMEGDPDAPVVMLNLLRFSENATGSTNSRPRYLARRDIHAIDTTELFLLAPAPSHRCRSETVAAAGDRLYR